MTDPDKRFDLIIIGGGASGYFAAINCAIKAPNIKILILEQSKNVLHKVRISGGGRCNVTHACYQPKALIENYPRGKKELLSPFLQFSAEHTTEWFLNQGVKLKTEADGRMFPVSDSSETIIECFTSLVDKYHIEVLTNHKVKEITRNDENKTYSITAEGKTYQTPYTIIAAGSSPFVWNLLHNLDYEVTSPVPSLFTFNLPGHPITQLMGLSMPHAKVKIPAIKLTTEGPILITHWGLSGPAVLKASAWGAVELAKTQYDFEAQIDWIPSVTIDDIKALKDDLSKKKVSANPQFGLPQRLWIYFIHDALSTDTKIDNDKNWASLSKENLNAIISNLKSFSIHVKGKSTFKDEFVTAGGVALRQINFKNFESKVHSGLYMTGEVLNIDAITGGFNFQAAWTGGYLAGSDVAKKFNDQ